MLRLVRLAEFKRKQAAPGLKVTDRAFGTGWRMPIAARAHLRNVIHGLLGWHGFEPVMAAPSRLS